MVDSGVVTLQPSGRQLFVSVIDGLTSDAPTLFFLHGLGSSHTFYEAAFSQSTSRLISYDFNGHGLSPLQTPLSIDSLANDLKELMDHFGVERARGIVAHSMSGLVATTFASKWPEKVETLGKDNVAAPLGVALHRVAVEADFGVPCPAFSEPSCEKKTVLLGPMSAIPDSTRAVMRQRAATVLSSGLSSIVSKIAESATSSRTKRESPLTLSLIRALVLGTNPQAYAAACEALASAQDPDYSQIRSKVVVIGGSEDYLSDGKMIDAIVGKINAPRSTESSVGLASKVVLEGVGHWIAIEDPKRVAQELNKCFGI